MSEDTDNLRHFNVKNHEPELATMSVIIQSLNEHDLLTRKRILIYVLNRVEASNE